MPTAKNIRRHRRIPYSGPVRISWEEHGQARFATGKCLDISEDGMRIESPLAIPRGTSIHLAADRIKLAGAAIVKHTDRRGSKHLLGLELSSAVLTKTIVELEAHLATLLP
jgi:hypothetical protein